MAQEKITLQAIEAIAQKDFLVWWEGFTKILNKEAQLISPRANFLQKHVAEVVSWVQQNNYPVRLVVLKPRQMGSSTITSAVITHFLRANPNTTGCLLGDELDTSISANFQAMKGTSAGSLQKDNTNIAASASKAYIFSVELITGTSYRYRIWEQTAANSDPTSVYDQTLTTKVS